MPLMHGFLFCASSFYLHLNCTLSAKHPEQETICIIPEFRSTEQLKGHRSKNVTLCHVFQITKVVI